MAYAHGWPKVRDFGEKSQAFFDPFGIGSAASLGLATFAEFACAILVALGLFTRFTAVPVVVTMLVAAFWRHGADPFSQKELALVYAVPFVALVLTGGGEYSLDTWIQERRGGRK